MVLVSAFVAMISAAQLVDEPLLGRLSAETVSRELALSLGNTTSQLIVRIGVVVEDRQQRPDQRGILVLVIATDTLYLASPVRQVGRSALLLSTCRYEVPIHAVCIGSAWRCNQNLGERVELKAGTKRRGSGVGEGDPAVLGAATVESVTSEAARSELLTKHVQSRGSVKNR